MIHGDSLGPTGERPDVGQICDPDPVRGRRREVPFHPVWSTVDITRDRRERGLAASTDTGDALTTHDSSDLVPAHGVALTAKLMPDLLNAVDTEVVIENPPDLDRQSGVRELTGRRWPSFR